MIGQQKTPFPEFQFAKNVILATKASSNHAGLGLYHPGLYKSLLDLTYPKKGEKKFYFQT